jgi:hypothetical protein
MAIVKAHEGDAHRPAASISPPGQPQRRPRPRATSGAAARACAAALGASLVAAAGPRPARADGGAIAGRVTFRDGAGSVPAGAVERAGWGHLVLTFRRGREVIDLRPDASGLFAERARPGVYRIEYLRLGERVEFFSPMDVVVDGQGVTCLGTLEVTVPGGAHGIGANRGSEVQVLEGCRELEPELRRRLGASAVIAKRPTPGETQEEPRDVARLLTGLRVELPALPHSPGTVGGSVVYPFTGYLAGAPTTFATIGAARYDGAFFAERAAARAAGRGGAPAGAAPGAAWAVAAGGGVSASALELGARAGHLRRGGAGPRGVFGEITARLDLAFVGVGVRYSRFPSAAESVLAAVVDLSPVAVLGSLL